MIYFASYFKPEHWHGLIYQISRSKPPDIWVDGELELFKPTDALLSWWKKSAQDGKAEREYAQRYYHDLDQGLVLQWLDQFKRHLHQEHDLTFLCWEPPGQFCHRNLMARVIKKHIPWLLGGQDARQIEVGDTVQWPYQEGGNLEWLSPYQVKAIDHNQARLAWIDEPVNLAELRIVNVPQ